VSPAPVPLAHEQWREERQRSLQATDSWLGLVGLFWLEEGDNTVGAAPESTVLLPSGPSQLGVLLWCKGLLRWLPVTGDAQTLATDADGAPSIVTSASLAFFVIEREGQLAVRVRDLDWAAKQPFAGIELFPYDATWRIEADWKPLSPPLTIEVPNVSGDLKPVQIAWQAVFKVGEVEVTLLPMSVSESGAFFVFRDVTSGRVSYGAGRFLNASPPSGGRIVLDFNFAYSPPCAFTPFATCPLPPPENWLSFPVPAGEIKPAGH
jgi:uncharacterized protein (DUF1684 family)